MMKGAYRLKTGEESGVDWCTIWLRILRGRTFEDDHGLAGDVHFPIKFMSDHIRSASVKGYQTHAGMTVKGGKAMKGRGGSSGAKPVMKPAASEKTWLKLNGVSNGDGKGT